MKFDFYLAASTLRVRPAVLVVLLLAACFGGCSILVPREIKQLERARIFSVSESGEALVLNGVVNSTALEEFEEIAGANPSIKHLEIVDCYGSINDDINLELAKFIYDNNFNIHLLDSGSVASGGTDLFLAGRTRTTGVGTRIGVHSWAGRSKTATDFAVGHEHHLPYISYYHSIGFSQEEAEKFYYFTINAASADSIHWMTEEEIVEYEMLKVE